MAIKTIYHKAADKLSDGSNPAFAEVQNAMKETLEAAVQKFRRDHSSRRNLVWGEVNQVTFFNALAGLIPDMFALPVKRDGAWETVDPAGPSFGPNFRIIMILKEGEPIRGFNVMPAGNWAGTSNTAAAIGELLMWRDGKQRELVPFAE